MAKTVIDVGTGPGLPGLPLAICNPDKEFVLLDSLGKRISFIRQVVHELKLTNVTPVLARVQDYDSKNGLTQLLVERLPHLQICCRGVIIAFCRWSFYCP